MNVKKSVPDLPMDKKLADMLSNAMAIRELSYDKTAADAAADAADAEAAGDPSNAWAYIADYAQFYGLTLEQAAEKAATEAGEPTMASILYYLMVHAWNDVQAWIEEHNLN